MKSRRKLARRMLGGTALLLVVCQFIRPARNLSSAPPGPGDFIVKYDVPEPFRQQLQTSCYNCHSANTRYPWYASVQPVGWWLQHHVNEGRAHLNLSRFDTYTGQGQADKIDHMIDELIFRTMPLKSYTLLHPEARLTPTQADDLADWLQHLHDSLDD